MSHRLRCLITAGPTREHLDPVRFLSNGSSGRMGYALAAAAVRPRVEGGPGQRAGELPPPPGVTVHRVISAAEMFRACEPLFYACDLFIAVAAVADYRPRIISPRKLGKSAGRAAARTGADHRHLENPRRAQAPGADRGRVRRRNARRGGSARRKLEEKKLDWIVANDVSRPGLGMNAEKNAVLLLGARGSGPVIRAGAEIGGGGVHPQARGRTLLARHRAAQIGWPSDKSSGGMIPAGVGAV